MIEQAIKDLQLGKRHLFVVGDKLTDIELARRAGAEGILVLSGYGEEERKRLAGTGKTQPAYLAADLLQAIQWLISRLSI